MATPAAHPPIVSLDNFEARKEEITQQLMDAAMTSGMIQVPGISVVSLVDVLIRRSCMHCALL